MTKKKHGGPREGSGRKSQSPKGPRPALNTRVAPETMEFLKKNSPIGILIDRMARLWQRHPDLAKEVIQEDMERGQ